MLSKHGALESAILSSLWELEESGVYTNTVKNVYDLLAKTDKKAYTTIKTVMDRLVEKNIILRYKQGKKFYYRTAYTNNEVIIKSLKDIAQRYCNGDMSKLVSIIRNYETHELSGISG